MRQEKENRKRDYLEKRKQYAARGIPEYWIVDPDDAVVIVLKLAGKYISGQSIPGNRLYCFSHPAAVTVDCSAGAATHSSILNEGKGEDRRQSLLRL